MHSSDVYRSAIPGIEWPALPAPNAARLIALLLQLDQSQWWSADVLAAAQFGQLNRLVAHAYNSVPLYRQRLSAIGYAPGQAMTPDLWRSLPILSRRDIQQAGRSLQSTLVPPDHGATSTGSTSGSTGVPVTVAKTALEQFFWAGFTLREEAWHRRDKQAKLAVIRGFHDNLSAYPNGAHYPDWGHPVAAIFHTGPAATLSITTSLEHQAEWLVRQNPGYILSAATNLMFLARHFRDRNLTLPNLKGLRSFGEVVDAEVRETCRAVWGAEIADIYTTVETGYIALQCPAHDHLHVQSEAAVVEVLDAAGAPCRPGELGRVVVTPLHNFAMPLLRYEIGDYAEVGAPCSCGRGLPVLKRVLGRARDMVKLPNGETRFGWLSSRNLVKIEPLVQHQVVQKSLHDIEVRLVSRRALTPAELDLVRESIEFSFGTGFTLSFTYHDDLPRTAGGKFFVFRSEIND